MLRVRIVHWKASQAGPLIEACRAGGFEVEYDDARFGALAKMIRHNPPDVLLIDLTCQPTHGRDAAIYLRRTKYARYIPLVFADGEPEKVAALRQMLPDATFSTRKQIRARIRSAFAKRVAEPPVPPVVPPGLMDIYRSRTAAQKLGVKEGFTVAVIDPPRNYAAVLGELPADVDLVELADAPDPAGELHPVTLWFVSDVRVYQARLRGVWAIADRTKLWVVWRKGVVGKEGSNGLTQYLVRQTANDAGLVDYKICAVNDQWSAMAFARRKS